MKSKLIITGILLVLSTAFTFAQPTPPDNPFNHQVPINNYIMIALIFAMILLLKKEKEK